MNPPNKKPTGAGGVPSSSIRQAAQTPRIKPVIAHPTQKVLQPKITNGAVNRKPPTAPPVFRPQPAPRVVSTRNSLAQGRQSDQGSLQPRPFVCQPAQQKLIQPKANLLGASARVGSVVQRAQEAPVQRNAVVVMTIGDRPYHGKSSGQNGHAEMDALTKFINEHDTVADAFEALQTADPRTVECPNQDVCGSCTMILRALGFAPAAGTTFSPEKSGGVSWGCSNKVKDLMKHADLDAVIQNALRAGAK